MERIPAVAGRFYTDQPQILRREVESYLAGTAAKITARGLVAPHAGYMYSGAIAGKTFARVHIPKQVIILGPNHHGLGHPAAVYSSGSWLTPLGKVPIAEGLAAAVLKGCPGMAADCKAHQFEHSLEVQVPFLQVQAPECSIVPICLGPLGLDDILRIGEDLGQVLSDHPEEVLIVASSDMTHYESGAAAREKDLRALQRVIELDPAGLYRTVRDGRISMCGVIPVTLMLAAALKAGAKKATLIHYGNSGDVTGDQAQVVGYAGVVVE